MTLPISHLFRFLRPPVNRNFWKFDCRPYFLCYSKNLATIFKIWPLNGNMTPQSNTLVLLLKKLRHDYFFLNKRWKDSILSKLFIVIWEKALRAKREAQGSWSTNHLERSERPKGSLSTNHLEQSERLKRSWSTKRLERSERPKGSLWTNHLERSERLKWSLSTNHLERSERLKGYYSSPL